MLFEGTVRHGRESMQEALGIWSHTRSQEADTGDCRASTHSVHSIWCGTHIHSSSPLLIDLI